MRKLICLLVMLIFSGCVMHQRYPIEWAPLATEKIQNISGTYINRAIDTAEYKTQGAENESSEIYLSRFIFDDLNGEIHKAITDVEIKQSGDKEIRFIARKDNAIVKQKVISLVNSQYRLTAKGLRMSAGQGLLSKEGVVGVESIKYIFNKSTDGALIVNSQNSGFGIVLLIPIAGSESTWYKFRPKEH